MPKAESSDALVRSKIKRIANSARLKPKKLPPLRANSAKRPVDERYREQFGVIIICPDEDTQRGIYTALRKLESCRLRVVTT